MATIEQLMRASNAFLDREQQRMACMSRTKSTYTAMMQDFIAWGDLPLTLDAHIEHEANTPVKLTGKRVTGVVIDDLWNP